MGLSAGERLACAEKEAFDFLWCLELWGGAKASLQYGCPGFVQKCLMSQFEKGFVLSVSSFTQPWGKTKRKNPSTLRCPGRGLLGSQWSPGQPNRSTSPAAAAVWTNLSPPT